MVFFVEFVFADLLKRTNELEILPEKCQQTTKTTRRPGTECKNHRIFRHWKGNLHKWGLKQISGSGRKSWVIIYLAEIWSRIIFSSLAKAQCVRVWTHKTRNYVKKGQDLNYTNGQDRTGHRDKVMMSLARSEDENCWRLFRALDWRELALSMSAASMTTHDVAPGCRAKLPRPNKFHDQPSSSASK